mgnify:CR=1 FL=1
MTDLRREDQLFELVKGAQDLADRTMDKLDAAQDKVAGLQQRIRELEGRK